MFAVWIQLKGSGAGAGPAAIGFADPMGTQGGGGGDLPFDATVYLNTNKSQASETPSLVTLK